MTVELTWHLFLFLTPKRYPPYLNKGNTINFNLLHLYTISEEQWLIVCFLWNTSIAIFHSCSMLVSLRNVRKDGT